MANHVAVCENTTLISDVMCLMWWLSMVWYGMEWIIYLDMNEEFRTMMSIVNKTHLSINRWLNDMEAYLTSKSEVGQS